jgi:hypothetical protein
MVDPVIMERVVANVPANALRYSPGASLPLLTARARGDRVELRVADRGPGVPEADRNRMYVPFQRLGDTDSTTGVSARPLPGLLAHLAPVLGHYGYLAVGGFITLEDFGVPVPGETIPIAAAVYPGVGKLNIVAVGLVAILAAVVGDNIGYTVGFFGGRALVLRFGKYVGLTDGRLGKAEVLPPV